jgi:hypothetical protein
MRKGDGFLTKRQEDGAWVAEIMRGEFCEGIEGRMFDFKVFPKLKRERYGRYELILNKLKPPSAAEGWKRWSWGR